MRSGLHRSHPAKQHSWDERGQEAGAYGGEEDAGWC